MRVRKMIRRLSVLLSALVLVACGAGSGPEAQTGGGGESQPSGDTIELVYKTHDFDTAVALNKQLIEQFQAENPNITITYDYQPHDNYEQALLTAFAGGSGPDVFWAGDWMVPQFLENGILAPVDPKAYGVDSHEALIKLFTKDALDVFVRDGKVYTGGISEYNTFSLVYNVDHFKEAGLPLPSENEPMTWEQFAQYTEKLGKPQGGERTRNALGWDFKTPIWSVLVIEPMVRQLGGELVDPATGAPTFNTPQVAQVLQYLQDLRLKYDALDPAFQSDLLEDFAGGRTSAIIAGPWALSLVRQQNPDLNFAVAPLPVFEQGQRTTTLYSWAWYVNAHSSPEKQAAAFKFLNFLTSHGREWWDKVKYIQPRLLKVDGQDLAAYRAESEPLLKVFQEDFKYGESQFQSTHYYEFADALLRAQSRVLEGEDVQQVLEETQSDLAR